MEPKEPWGEVGSCRGKQRENECAEERGEGRVPVSGEGTSLQIGLSCFPVLSLNLAQD